MSANGLLSDNKREGAKLHTERCFRRWDSPWVPFPGVAKRDYRHAIADFNKSIEVDPKFSLAYSNRGAVYESQRKYDQAMADFGTAISLNPDLALAYYNRATIYEALGRRADAISEYRRALLKDPNDQDIKNALKKLGVDQSEDMR
jgi:tetratricopeptide (TPR) repeat protein